MDNLFYCKQYRSHPTPRYLITENGYYFNTHVNGKAHTLMQVLFLIPV